MKHSLPDGPALPGPASNDIAPYAGLNLPAKELDCVAQVDALRADPEIAGYLRGAGQEPWTRKRYNKAFAGLAITAGLLLAVYALLPGNLFSRYRPPAPQDTPKPQPYAAVAETPILFRESVRDINADLQSAARWRAAFEGLKTLADSGESGGIEPPPELRLWAYQEMLVMLASRELPPGLYSEDYADELYAGIERLLAANPQEAPPFRAASAYARILASRPRPKDAEERRAGLEATAALIETLRAEHGPLVDGNRDLLIAEAETHIALLPREYEAGNRYLDYHWRRAAHAILRLYELYGRNDAAVRQLDRQRWRAVYRYFDYTLLTLDTKRLGRIASARLDGVDYTRADIRAKLDELE